MMQKSNHYEILKLISTILVVFAHSSRMYTPEGIIHPANSSIFLELTTKIIYAFHMPLFIAISGMVYGLCIDDYDKYHDQQAFIMNKFIRLYIPYIFFGLFYVAPIMVRFHFTPLSYFKYIYNGIILSNDSRHLWYLLVLFEIFILHSFIRNIVQRMTSKASYIIIIVLLLLILSLYSYKLPTIFQLSNLGYYLLFFNLGYLFNKYYEKTIKIIANPLFIIIVALIFSTLFLSNISVISRLRAVMGSIVLIGFTTYIPSYILNHEFIKITSKNGFVEYI